MEFIIEHPVLTAYLFLKINSLLTVIHICTIVAAIAGVISVIWLLFANGDANCEYSSPARRERAKAAAVKLKQITKMSFLALGIFVSLEVIIPNQQQVAIMTGVGAGVTLAEKIGKSETMNKAYVALDSYINKELDEVISKNIPKKDDK